MPTGELLQADTKHKLGNLRKGLRWRLTGEGAAWVLLAVVVAVLASLAVDYVLRLEEVWLRAVLLGLLVAGIVYVCWRQLLRPVSAPMSDLDLVMLVEKRHASLGDRLASALVLSSRNDVGEMGMSEAMVQATALRANEIAATLDFRVVVERQNLRRMCLLALCAAMLLTGFSVWQSPLMSAWLQRNLLFRPVDYPQRTYLEIAGGNTFEVMRGDRLDIQVVTRVGSVAPEAIYFHANYPSTGWIKEEVKPGSDGRTFIHTFDPVIEEFSFHISGADDKIVERETCYVKVVDPPDIKKVTFTIKYPGYIDRPDEPITDNRGVLQGPVGGWINVDAIANKDLTSAMVRVDGSPDAALVVSALEEQNAKQRPMTHVTGRFPLPLKNEADSKNMQFVFTDLQGHTNRHGSQYVLRIVPDMPPTIDARREGVGNTISPQAKLPMMISFKDDYGPSRIRKLILVGKEKVVDAGLVVLPEETVGHDKVVKKREFVQLEEVDLQGRGFKPGDVISVVFEAADTLPESFGGPNVTKSMLNEFRVVSEEDLVDDLVRRLSEWRLEFEQHQAVQRTATAKTEAVAAALEKGPMDGEIRVELEQSATMQGTVSSECSKAADTVQAILEEITNNRVGDQELQQNVSVGVRDLRVIAKDMIRLQAELGDIFKATDNATAANLAKTLHQKQDDIRTRLEAIVASIAKVFDIKAVENEILRLQHMSEAQEKAIYFLGKQVPEIFIKPKGAPTTGPSVVQPK
jgi:hypothetical protein